MSEQTGISWADHTFNLWWGCERVSPACDNCYAERLATRYGFDVWGLEKPRRFFKAAHYNEPIGWNAKAQRDRVRRRVFVNSMADICEIHPNTEVARLMADARHDLFTRIMPITPWLDYLLLTKRPANYAKVLPREWIADTCPSNVWIGFTAENQEWFDRRVLYALMIPAAVHWVSYEPALSHVNFRGRLGAVGTGRHTRINWVISGGESQSGCRPDHLEYHRSARDQCHAAGAAYWFKQHGGLSPKRLGDLLDGRQHHDLPAAA